MDPILLDYLPLVRKVARNLHPRLPRSVRIEDLEQDGVIGLMRARRRFDLGRGLKFGTYAARCVAGEMLDGLRRLDWCPRQSRHLPRTRLVSLNEARGTENLERENAAEIEEFWQLHTRWLPPKLRSVVILRYREQLSGVEIARSLGVSASRVCQMLGHAMGILRERFNHGQDAHAT